MGNIIKMIRHNSSRLLSGLIVFALLCGIIIPAQSASAKETEGVEAGKTVIYDEETGTYKLRLEGYVTGATITTEVMSNVPTDFVISMDISHSMPPCINCGAAGIDSKTTGLHIANSHCEVYPDDLDLNTVYYRGTNEDKPVYYCADCDDWYSEQHTTDSHGGQVFVCAYPNGTDYTAQFYSQNSNVNCGEECTHADWKHPIYKANLDIEDTYTKVAGSSKAADLLVYCEDCGFWYPSNNLKHAAGDTHESAIYHPYKIANDPRKDKDVQFYKPCVSRMQAAREAVEAFVAKIKEMSKGPDGVSGTEDDVPHRVAIIGFGGNQTGDAKVGVSDYQTITGLAKSKYTSTGIYSLFEEDKVNEGFGYYEATESYNNFESYHIIKGDETLATNCYTNALRDVTDSTEYSVLEEGIRELNYNYGTYISYASIMTENIFENTYSDDIRDGISRNRIAVFFTDGQPDGDSEGVYDQADESIQPAYRMKNNENYKATVYTIGIFEKADASKIWHLTSDNVSQDEYMHMLSSNYPTAYTFESARRVRDVGTTKNRVATITDVNSNLLIVDSEGNVSVDPSKPGYYYTAKNADELTNVFQSIANESVDGGADYKLNELAIMQDVLTENWEIDAKEEQQPEEVINAYTMTYIGDDSETGEKLWEIKDDDYELPAIVNADGKTIQVTGFDYAGNYVGTDIASDGTPTNRGKKLVLEIPIRVSEENIGGKQQPTNVTNVSAIYGMTDTGELHEAEHFDSPSVDIPTSITIQKLITGYGADVNEEFKFEYIVEEGFNPPAENENAPLYEKGDGENDGSSGNYLKAVGYAHESKEFTLKANETFTIDNLLVGSVLKIKEVDIPDGYVLKSIVPYVEEELPEEDDEIVSPDQGDDNEGDSGEGEPEIPEEGEPEIPEEGEPEIPEEGEPEIPEEDPITEGDDGYYYIKINEDFCGIRIDVTNELTVTDITVSKEVTGNMGDISRKFDFTASLKKGEEELVFPAADDSNTSYTIKDGKAVFSLKDDENIVLNNIPYGTTLIIEEAATDYEVSSSIDGGNFVDGNTATVLEVSKDHHIAFKNHKEVAVDTGVDFDTPFRPIVLIGIMIIAILGGGKIYLEKQRSLHRIRR